jgi:hypothetical protein
VDPVHLHLALNHVPVVGLGFALVTLALAFFWKNEPLGRLGLAFLVLIALATVVVRFTGSGAEDAVEKLPGVTERVIERHEDAANLALILVGVLGLAAAAGLAGWRGRSAPRWFHAGVLALVVIGGGVMAYASNLGGQIRHTEIRSRGAAAAETGAAEREQEKDDD